MKRIVAVFFILVSIISVLLCVSGCEKEEPFEVTYRSEEVPMGTLPPVGPYNR